MDHPQDCPELREALSELCREARTLTERLLSAISLSLGVDQDYLGRIHRGMLSEGQSSAVENCTTLRSIHYPPIPDKLSKQPGIIRYNSQEGHLLNIGLVAGNIRTTEPSRCSSKTCWEDWR